MVSGRLISAEQRIGNEGGGLARHSAGCNEEISWEEAKMVNIEGKLRQRKVLEGIMSLREKHKWKRVLNSFEQLDRKPLLL